MHKSSDPLNLGRLSAILWVECNDRKHAHSHCRALVVFLDNYLKTLWQQPKGSSLQYSLSPGANSKSPKELH
jgi:hypothetical protein